MVVPCTRRWKSAGLATSTLLVMLRSDRLTLLPFFSLLAEPAQEYDCTSMLFANLESCDSPGTPLLDGHAGLLSLGLVTPERGEPYVTPGSAR
jgi:hypothetical protein